VEVLNRLLQLEAVIGGSDIKHDALNQCLALEALQLYAPLGHALGLNQESLALENLSLKFLFPTSYQQTCDWLSAYVSHHNNVLESSRQALENAIVSNEAFLEKARGVVVQARAKSPISTLKKLLRLGNSSQGGRTRDEIFDVLGLRAIVLPRTDMKDEEEAERCAIEACYIIDQIAIELWPVIDSRAKDYIAAPKPNGYSSIHHTVVVGGEPSTNLELQIRTAST
jgi:(p)ppGpp synthase/HD superfamily hydrolase